MARNLRLPNPTSTASLKAESDLVIPFMTGAAVIARGGGTFGQLGAWKKAYPAAVYSQFVIEVFCDAAGLQQINDGTQAQTIGLYGRYVDTTGATKRSLLGVLGYPLGNAMPQIICDGTDIGFAQLVNVATVYDAITIGGVFGNINVPAGTISCFARPIIERDYGG